MEILTSFEHFHPELWIGIRISTKQSHFPFWPVSFDSLLPPGLMELKDEALPMRFGSASHYNVKMPLLSQNVADQFWPEIKLLHRHRILQVIMWLVGERRNPNHSPVSESDASASERQCNKTSFLPLNRVHLAADTFLFLCLSVWPVAYFSRCSRFCSKTVKTSDVRLFVNQNLRPGVLCLAPNERAALNDNLNTQPQNLFLPKTA